MKVLLIKDVYKLGRAGEIKKVAAGYGRNYLIPKGFAIPATTGSMGQADRIKVKATERRAKLNEELSDIAEVLTGKTLYFPVKAGETGHLYGSVSDDDIIDAIEGNYEIKLEKRQIETEPIRDLGTYKVPIHFTMDLVPEITVVVHREGELPGSEEDQEQGKETLDVAEVETLVQEEDISEVTDEESNETEIEEAIEE